MVLGVLALAALGSSLGAFAGDTANITLNYVVSAINQIATSVGAITLTIDAASAGSQPDADTNSDTVKYSITTNEGGKKLTAVIDVNMPEGLTLKIDVTAPSSTGTTVAGAQTLSTTVVDVVTAIGAVAEADIDIALTLETTVTFGVVSSTPRTITLTLTTS